VCGGSDDDGLFVVLEYMVYIDEGVMGVGVGRIGVTLTLARLW
jgi:hypothetical protein